jgi:flavin-dependent dehydrogenase
MNASAHFDVIIVGGGPAGCACGAVLARAGIKVAICEKAKFPRDKICGDCVNPASWGLLKIIGVSSELRALNLCRIDGVRLAGAKGVELAAPIGNDPERPFFAIKRRVFDALLLKNAAGEGAVVLEQTQATDIGWNRKWHVVVRRNNAEDTGILTSDFLVGADGRNSLVARKLDKARDHRGKWLNGRNARLRVGIQWHTKNQPQIGSMIELFLFDSGYCGVVNVDGEQANIAMVVDAELAKLAGKNFTKFLRATVFENAAAAKTLTAVSPLGNISTTFPIEPIVRSLRHPHAILNAMLIGDAQCTVEPFTGQGIYFALQNGVRAAGELIARFHAEARLGDFSFRNRFWVNQIYSPILRSKALAEGLISLGARFPGLVPWALKTVFPSEEGRKSRL